MEGRKWQESRFVICDLSPCFPLLGSWFEERQEGDGLAGKHQNRQKPDLTAREVPRNQVPEIMVDSVIDSWGNYIM